MDDSQITMACEYGGHGINGPAGSPVYAFAEMNCPHLGCTLKAKVLFMCYECLYVERFIECGRCKQDVHNTQAFRPVAKW